MTRLDWPSCRAIRLESVSAPGPDRHVELFADHIDAAVGHRDHEVDVRITGPEIRQHGRQPVLGEGRAHIDPDRALRPAAGGHHLRFGRFDRRKDLAAAIEQGFALCRHHQPPGRALQKLHTQPVLEPRDCLGNARRRQPGFLGGRGKTAAFHHPDKYPDLVGCCGSIHD
jgi:hypothetical protein